MRKYFSNKRRPGPIYSFEETIKLFRLIANAELAVVPNADHFLITQSEIYASIIQDFCERNNP